MGMKLLQGLTDDLGGAFSIETKEVRTFEDSISVGFRPCYKTIKNERIGCTVKYKLYNLKKN